MSTKAKKTTFPTLYHKTAKGATNIWTVWAEGSCVYTEWGQLEGLLQTSCKEVVQKNLGRANETSVGEQAILEAESMWLYKKERKYSETIEETEERIFLPMLAKKFEDRKRFIGLTEDDFEAYIQAKLNGTRALASWIGHGKNRKIKLTSRGGKEYFLPHVCREIENSDLPESDVLDGELYVHGTGLQEINTLVRPTKNFNPESVKMEYHVYDYIHANENNDGGLWSERNKNLKDFFKRNSSVLNKVVMVSGKTVRSEKEIYAFHDECVADGYEGAIVRLLDGVYKFGYRSDKLLKVKAFMDDEFEIIDFTNGDGKFSECIIFKCKTKEGGTFKVVPKGTFEKRAKWLKHGKSFIGKKLTVQYFGFTEDGLPYIPIGLAVRLEEDM